MITFAINSTFFSFRSTINLTIKDQNIEQICILLQRIADALDRISPLDQGVVDFSSSDGFVWHAENNYLEPVKSINRIEIDLLKGVDQSRNILIENTRRFGLGFPANNALLWGARGMGKSSLVKAAHRKINMEIDNPLILIEIHREDIPTLPSLLKILRPSKYRFILFCDDLSFESDDTTYKSLKALLEGGIEGRPTNVIFYATSNRRHLMPRAMIENEQSTAIHGGEAVEESVSLSDRFGLWLGFHACDQATFLKMVEAYIEWFEIDINKEELHAEAIKWSMARGGRSGRVAWQFVLNIAGQLGVKLNHI